MAVYDVAEREVIVRGQIMRTLLHARIQTQIQHPISLLFGVLRPSQEASPSPASSSSLLLL